MGTLEIAQSLEQILEGMSQLSDREKRTLAISHLVRSEIGSIRRRVGRQPDLRAGTQ